MSIPLHFRRLMTGALLSMCLALSAAAAVPPTNGGGEVPPANAAQETPSLKDISQPCKPSPPARNDQPRFDWSDPLLLLWYNPRQLLWSSSLS
jgi:hypothetical protein